MKNLSSRAISNSIENSFKVVNDIKLDSNTCNSIFSIKTVNQWLRDASNKPIPKPLYLSFWFEGEVCILFADTNLGKSILAVQIADIISQNEKVLYIDFELSEKQFEARYSNDFKNHYNFNENFIRAEINPEKADYKEVGFKCLEDFIKSSIEHSIKETNAKVLIIDNLTYLSSENEKAKEALPLMKHLIELKKNFGLSLLVLAHTPKRIKSQPITNNDLQGSKMIINFCDSAFSIGESSQGKTTRYLKQIKTRNSEFEYDTDNVAVFEISKENNFLSFKYVQTSSEHEHLRIYTPEDKDKLIEKAKELHKRGLTQRDIAKDIGVALGTVNKYLNDK